MIYEFLVRSISRSLVEGDSKNSSRALKIIKKHFKQNSELYKEFRLINSLIKTRVSSPMIAASIVQEAKSAARSHDVKKLDHEKSLLLRSINYGMDSSFFEQHVNEYKMYATIQSLLNNWRSGTNDLEKLAFYEEQLLEWLTSSKSEESEQVISEHTPGTSRLLMRVMMKKLNEKYAGVLNDRQRSIIKSYVWSRTNNDNQSNISKCLYEIRDSLLSSINDFVSENKENEYIVKKLDSIKQNIMNENINEPNDDTITRFMMYVKLNDEMAEEEKKNV